MADLEGSRKVRDREGLARRLEEALAELRPGNTGAGGGWIAPLESVRGLDELSGAAGRPGPAVRASFHLNRALWPHRFRFALAYGPVDVALASGEAGAMDGPAFHRAADALERARRDGLPLALAAPAAAPPALALAETAARLHAAWMQDWTARQAAVASSWMRLRHQGRVAAALGVTQPTVSESLSKARLKDLLRAEEDLSAFLDWLADQLPEGDE